MRFPKPLAYIDTETTGLDYNLHEVIEVAVLRVEPDGTQTRFHSLIKPENIEIAEEKALQVNGYRENPVPWESAPLMKEVAPKLAAFIKGCILVGHNIPYDEGMLTGHLKRVGVDAKIPFRKLDTITLVYEHLFPLGLSSAKLDDVREFLGWSKWGAHRAMKDVEDTRRLHLLLSRASFLLPLKIRTGRFLEKWTSPLW